MTLFKNLVRVKYAKIRYRCLILGHSKVFFSLLTNEYKLIENCICQKKMSYTNTYEDSQYTCKKQTKHATEPYIIIKNMRNIKK